MCNALLCFSVAGRSSPVFSLFVGGVVSLLEAGRDASSDRCPLLASGRGYACSSPGTCRGACNRTSDSGALMTGWSRSINDRRNAVKRLCPVVGTSKATYGDAPRDSASNHALCHTHRDIQAFAPPYDHLTTDPAGYPCPTSHSIPPTYSHLATSEPAQPPRSTMLPECARGADA